MGSQQSSEPETHSVSMSNPNGIEISKPALSQVLGEGTSPPAPASDSSTTVQGKEYSPDETGNLAAPLDEDYTNWFQEVEKQNVKCAEQVRDALTKKCDDLYHRFSYVEKNPPCQELQSSVLKCMEANRESPLHCSDEVEAFKACVLEHQLSYDRSEHIPKPRQRPSE